MTFARGTVERDFPIQDDAARGRPVGPGARTSRPTSAGRATGPSAGVRKIGGDDHSSTCTSGRRAACSDSLLLRAAGGRPGPHPPVWFMRQAGRSLPEYRALRVDRDMLEACRTPT